MTDLNTIDSVDNKTLSYFLIHLSKKQSCLVNKYKYSDVHFTIQIDDQTFIIIPYNKGYYLNRQATNTYLDCIFNASESVMGQENKVNIFYLCQLLESTKVQVKINKHVLKREDFDSIDSFIQNVILTISNIDPIYTIGLFHKFQIYQQLEHNESFILGYLYAFRKIKSKITNTDLISDSIRCLFDMFSCDYFLAYSSTVLFEAFKIILEYCLENSIHGFQIKYNKQNIEIKKVKTINTVGYYYNFGYDNPYKFEPYLHLINIMRIIEGKSVYVLKYNDISDFDAWLGKQNTTSYEIMKSMSLSSLNYFINSDKLQEKIMKYFISYYQYRNEMPLDTQSDINVFKLVLISMAYKLFSNHTYLDQLIDSLLYPTIPKNTQIFDLLICVTKSTCYQITLDLIPTLLNKIKIENTEDFFYELFLTFNQSNSCFNTPQANQQSWILKNIESLITAFSEAYCCEHMDRDIIRMILTNHDFLTRQSVLIADHKKITVMGVTKPRSFIDTIKNEKIIEYRYLLINQLALMSACKGYNIDIIRESLRNIVVIFDKSPDSIKNIILENYLHIAIGILRNIKRPSPKIFQVFVDEFSNSETPERFLEVLKSLGNMWFTSINDIIQLISEVDNCSEVFKEYYLQQYLS